jgi:hypothetical protein
MSIFPGYGDGKGGLNPALLDEMKKQNPSQFQSNTSTVKKGPAEKTLKRTNAPAPKVPSAPPVSAASRTRFPSGKRAAKRNVRRG